MITERKLNNYLITSKKHVEQFRQENKYAETNSTHKGYAQFFIKGCPSILAGKLDLDKILHQGMKMMHKTNPAQVTRFMACVGWTSALHIINIRQRLFILLLMVSRTLMILKAFTLSWARLVEGNILWKMEVFVFSIANNWLKGDFRNVFSSRIFFFFIETHSLSKQIR